MQVLVVDDSKAMRLIVKRAVRQAMGSEIKIHEAGDGHAALAQVAEVHPDLVLCDLNMPELDGIGVLSELRAQGNKVRFGLVTSEASEDVRNRAIDAGASFVLVKPFTAEAFKSVVDSDATRGAGSRTFDALPSAEDIEKLISTLLGKPVKSGKGRLVRPDSTKPAVLAKYGADDGTIEVVATFDLGLLVGCGCALTGMPAGEIASLTSQGAKGQLPDQLSDNIRELCNVFGSFFGGEKAGSGTLREVELPSTDFPADLMAQLRKPKERVNVAIKVDGYAEGGITLFKLV